MTIKPFTLCALLCLPLASYADSAQPLPAIVQKYAAAIKNLQTVQVAAAQTEPKSGPADTGTVIFVASDEIIRVTSHFGGGKSFTLTNDFDSKTITQWNDKQIYTQPAPKTLAELNPVLPMGVAAEIALSLLTDATNVTDYANLHDIGSAMIDGQPARKVVSVEDGDTATFWLSSKTGLPLQARFTGGRHDRTIALHYKMAAVGTNEAASVDLPNPPLPPRNLTVYTPPQEPELLKVGTPAPDFTLPRLSAYGTGKSAVQLSALKGQVVLIDFWASWCRPCKKTMPHIQAVHAAAGSTLTAISLNTWDTLPRATTFVKQHPNYTTQFLFDGTPADDGIAVKKYHVSGIPTVYIIDKEGNVAGAFVGDDPDAARQIEDTLGKLGVKS